MACLAGAAPAHAESHLIDLGFGDVYAGPVLAGERVAWTSPVAPVAVRGQFDLHLARFDGSDHRTVRVSLPMLDGYSVTSQVGLAASERRWALRVLVYSCANESACKYQFHKVLYAAVLSAPLGEEPVPMAGCTAGGEACLRCDEQGSVDVFADVVAFDEPCGAGGATVRDFSPGAAPAERTFEHAGAIRVAGRFAAIKAAGPEVYDWVTGVKEFGLDAQRFQYDLDVQADGTIAYTHVLENFDTELAWASPAEPFMHTVGVRSGSGGLFMDGIANGRIVFERQHESDLSSHIGVVALDGGRSALARPSARFGATAFDGSRIAYGQQPCTVTAIVVWDMTGAPPGLPQDECPAIGLGGSDARVDLAHRLVAVPIACPEDPALGCHGNVTVSGRLRGSRRQKRLAYDHVRLAPGADHAVELGLSRRLACRFVRSGDAARAKVELDSYTREGERSHRVRRSLLLRGLASCDG